MEVGWDAMQEQAPQRQYENHHLSSAHWDGFVPRADDIVIATPAKGGTTWTQAIVAHLIFPDGLPLALSDLSPWMDLARRPAADIHAQLAAQTHRRFIKTHLPADGLPLFSGVKYVVVGRDGRDLMMSMWNHYSNYSEDYLERLQEISLKLGVSAPAQRPEYFCPQLVHPWMVLLGTGWMAFLVSTPPNAIMVGTPLRAECFDAQLRRNAQRYRDCCGPHR